MPALPISIVVVQHPVLGSIVGPFHLRLDLLVIILCQLLRKLCQLEYKYRLRVRHHVRLEALPVSVLLDQSDLPVHLQLGKFLLVPVLPKQVIQLQV